MSLSLSNLKPGAGSQHSRKRVGRGNASGHGTFATRGIKGQKARSGVSGLKRLGMKQMILQVPKTRGFKSHYAKNQPVNLSAISTKFKTGEIVNPVSLAKRGLINKHGASTKILAKGELTVKGLIFAKVLMSAKAIELIKAQGGSIVVKEAVKKVAVKKVVKK